MTTRILITNDNKNLLPLDKVFEYGAIDTETNGLTPYQGSRVIGISLYFPEIDTSYYISLRHPESDIDPVWYTTVLLGRLPLMAKTWVLFNSKFDMHMLSVDGMKDFTRIEDVMIAAQLLNENEDLSNGGRKGAYTLKRLAAKYLGAEAVADEKKLFELAKSKGLDAKGQMWKLSAQDVADYAMADVEITWGLREFYMPKLVLWQQDKLYQRRNEFTLKALFRMERNGIKVSREAILKSRAEIEPQVNGIQDKFNTYLENAQLKFENKKKATDRINLNSPQQVKAFFNWAGYNIDSTNALVLHGLAERGDQWAADLLEYRGLSKVDSTYYEPYLSLIDADELIHTNYNAIGANTGRLSSDNPNLQNVPPVVKSVFVVRDGRTLTNSDYNALELRLGSHYADEPRMKAVFQRGGDPHQMTADLLGIPRNFAKRVNFGLIYGMGWSKAMGVIGIATEREARQIVEGWHSEYPAFRKAVNHFQQEANLPRDTEGSVGGNFKYLRLPNQRTRKYQELLKYGQDYTRDGFNFMVQGTGAAVNEESVLRVVNEFPNDDVFTPMLLVHDSFVYETPDDLVDSTKKVAKELMEDWQFSVPLKVEFAHSKKSYGDAH